MFHGQCPIKSFQDCFNIRHGQQSSNWTVAFNYFCREEFSREVVKFMALFDFCGKGKEKRLTEANEVMGELKSEEQRIKQGKY